MSKDQTQGKEMTVTTIVMMTETAIEKIIIAEEADQEAEIETEIEKVLGMIGVIEVIGVIGVLEVMEVLDSKKEHPDALIANKKAILLKIVLNPDKNFKEIQENHLHVLFVERKDIKKWTAHKDSNIYTDLSVI